MPLKRIKPVKLLSEPKPKCPGWQLVEWIGHVIAAKACILDDAKNAKGVVGSVICPRCQGVLKYSIASSNGHVAAKCITTEGCLHFLE
jgi:hypothetical protein